MEVKNKEDVIKLLESDIENISEQLCNDQALEIIIENDLFDKLKKLDKNFGAFVIDYAINHNDLFIIDNLGYLNKKVQNECFDIETIERILNLYSRDYRFMFSLDGKIVSKLLSFKPFLDYFMEASLEEWDYLVVEKDFVFPRFLINNPEVVNRYADIRNLDKSRFFINNLMKNNYDLAFNVEKARKNNIMSNIVDVNENGYFNRMDEIDDDYETMEQFYDFSYDVRLDLHDSIIEENDAELTKKYQDLTKKLQLKMLIDTYFKDIAYNFLANLQVMLSYLTSIDESIIKKDNLILYEQIMNFYNLDLDDRLKFIDSFKSNINYAKMFYEDYRKCRDHSYNLMNESILKLNPDSPLYNKQLSLQNDVPIYELNGEDFFAYVHSTGISRKNGNINWDVNDVIYLSLIGKENINTYQGGRMILFGFNQLIPNRIRYVYNTDACGDDISGTNKINQILIPSVLVINTLGFNEISYSECRLKEFKPDYIMCYDKITQEEIFIAQQMGLSIVLLHTKYYEKNEETESYHDNQYINPIVDEDPILEDDTLNLQKCLRKKEYC